MAQEESNISNKLPAYVEPDDKWESIDRVVAQKRSEIVSERQPQRITSPAADEPIAAVEFTRADWMRAPPMDTLQSVLSVLERDGVCLIRNAIPADVPIAIHEQMEPYLAARAETVGLNKQTAGDSGRQAGSVMSRARASWDVALHPLIMELCAAVLGRQV
eukprot:SAG31_NODE_2062_length_6536_cov_8.777691_8_plen_161_part_00